MEIEHPTSTITGGASSTAAAAASTSSSTAISTTSASTTIVEVASISPPQHQQQPPPPRPPLTVRFAEYHDLLLPPPSSSCQASSGSSGPIQSTSTPPYSSGSSSSPPRLSSGGPSTSPEPISPPSSAFVSASASPFSPPFSPSTPSPPPDIVSLPKEEQKSIVKPPLDQPLHPLPLPAQYSPIPKPSFRTSNDAFLELHFDASPAPAPATARPHPHHHLVPSPAGLPPLHPDPEPVHIVTISRHAARSSIASGAAANAPPTPFISTSPTSSFRPRTCDVYIGIHGSSSSLSRFSKWLRAELEFQGIACFLADRARYTDPHSHDIARRIIESCTFGVIVINKKTFRNLYSIEELQVFQERKNLVPLFLDLAPSDCLARDIVEKRGEVWEREGGELWRLFGGKEREWREAVDGLSRIEEWKLEAFNGNWRDCILRAVSLLGTRLGRRSVAERERVRKQRAEREEFPFPRNLDFVGREKELRAIEGLLFGNAEDEEDGGIVKEDNVRNKQATRSQLSRKGNLDKLSKQGKQSAPRDGLDERRRSDADRLQGRFMVDSELLSAGIAARRKSDSDRWQSFVAPGGLHAFPTRKSDSERWFRAREEYGFPMTSDIPWAGGEKESEILPSFGKSTKHIGAYKGELERKPPRSRASSRSMQMTSRRKHSQSIRSKSDPALNTPDLQGTTCISGGAGIGKTELALEFAYRFSQRYRMVLWIGGEARYFRQNYLNLSVFLGLDVGTETQVGPERGRIRTFDEQEREAFQRVKRELQRDVPYLLIIDNLESERDWWDRREVSELLPRAGGASHVIITTRLPRVLNMEPLRLLYLSGVEALSLMKGKREFSSQELDALKEIEEKLDRLTFGLGLVSRILTEMPIMPSVLLEKVNKGLVGDWTWGPREEATLKSNSFLVKLLGVSFTFLEQLDGPRKLACRMAMVGGWFAPFPVPISLLGAASMDYPDQPTTVKVLRTLPCCRYTSQTKRSELDAASLLAKMGLAKLCGRQGWIFFNEIVQVYARKRAGVAAAKAMVHSLRKRGAIALHSEHFWAACFLVFGFGNDPVLVELKATELISFIKKGALQLAFRAFTTFSRCRAALELLRLCTNMLEDVEKSFVSQSQDWLGKTLCWRKSSSSSSSSSDGNRQVDEYVWQQATVMKALLLETRAKLLLRGGQFDAGEELCRTCISIRTVMLGEHHPDTISAQETLAKLVRSRSST